MAPRVSLLVAVAVAMMSNPVSGFTPGSPLDNRNPSPSTNTQSDSMVPQNMLNSIGPAQERGSSWSLSSSDTLPSFRTAHGILSPETVSRMDEMTADGEGNPAVNRFLSTYRRKGPMSCLEMLSDPEVLPHLTNAMRDII